MERVEHEACQRGCRYARLASSDFQSPEFYQKLSYTLYRKLDTCPPGETVFYFQKELIRALRTFALDPRSIVSGDSGARAVGSKHLLGSADKPSRPSAVEHRPAELVSQSLILQNEFSNRIGELFALPPALESASALTLAAGCGSTCCLDCVSRSTKLVCGDMRHRCSLAGSKCGVPSGSAQLSCRSLGMACRIAGLRHLDLAPRPCPSLLNCLAGPRVRGLRRLEVVQNVLCTRSRPQSQELMIGVRERSPAADGDEAGVAIFGDDHSCTRPVASAQRLAFPATGEKQARKRKPPKLRTKLQLTPYIVSRASCVSDSSIASPSASQRLSSRALSAGMSFARLGFVYSAE